MRIQLFLGYPGKVQEQDWQGGIRHNFVILHIFAPPMLETHHGEFIGANTWMDQTGFMGQGALYTNRGIPKALAYLRSRDRS